MIMSQLVLEKVSDTKRETCGERYGNLKCNRMQEENKF